ncbi:MULTISPECIES: phytanoyl-CoA dioxygenase family protein [Sphingomonadales]|uniref:Ectoine hydroxylase-related dioxygenase (Phytanoyl-CoA dioxygenase family) n=1 Tax=Rhizorhapis suberifaciens TaxID=13656 RepID=A0A840HZJ5_9SPHN|nr:phytanoyl-CoA dioxygenase family protein [Rhizorhapis suberifaciens]MBB4642989.1 ectoine hydroxylase-related dioxygenase (phytanoyl-CoA dioxygenase family) [Rhizorhapis suberifaciens]
MDAKSTVLPTATSDISQANADLDQFGYAILADVVTSSGLEVLRKRLIEQAHAERLAGIALLNDENDKPLPKETIQTVDPVLIPRQIVMMLYNKGEPFREIAHDPNLLACVRHVLGGREFNLSGLAAQITNLGRTAQKLHTDQDQLPFDPSKVYVANILVMVSDFTEANGATIVVPGSHRWPRPPWSRSPNTAPDYPFRNGGMPAIAMDSVAVEGKAGSALILDGRLWHGAGAHVAPGVPRHAISCSYILPFLRQYENLPANVMPEIFKALSDEERCLLGYAGARGSMGYVEPAAARIGESTPIGLI